MDKDATARIPHLSFAILSLAIGLWLGWDSWSYRLVTYSMWADYWEHSAALTEWMRNLLNPGNPHLADGSSSARYMPVFLLLAALGRWLSLDAIELMAISAVLNYMLTVAGIWLFSNAYFRRPWAPAITFLVLFCAWGVPWIWSNVYELRSFFIVASYPSSLVFGLGLISLWLTLAFIRGQVGFFGGVAGLFAMSALMFLAHALTAVWAISGCGLLALLERDCPLRLRLLVSIAVLGGALAATWWPYFAVWDVVLARSEVVDDRTWETFNGLDAMLERARSGAWQHMFFHPVQSPIALGPALFGIPLCIWLLFRPGYRFIPLGAAVMAVPLVANIFFNIALAHRFLLFAVFYLHLAIVWAVLQLIDQWQVGYRSPAGPSPAVRIGLPATVLALMVAAVAHVGMLAVDYRGVHLKHTLEIINKREALPPGMSTPKLYRELTARLPDDAVVIGDARLTWPLPTFRGKAVSLPANHENSLVADQYERVAAEKSFLAATTSDAERRAIVTRYGATHVMINVQQTEPALLDWLARNTDPLIQVERFKLLVLRPAS
jgi:hypothetical protein